MSRQASGLKAWVIQRVTAIYLALFAVYAVAVFMFAPPSDHDAWRTMIASPPMTVAVLLFFLALLLHAWIGMRDVAIDYLRVLSVRVVFLSVFALALVAAGIWAAMVLVKTALAG